MVSGVKDVRAFKGLHRVHFSGFVELYWGHGFIFRMFNTLLAYP